MKVLLATFGSFGDVYPLIGLGRALSSEGEVTLITNGYFAATVANAGLEFLGISTAEQYEAITEEKDLWHPRRGLKLVAQAWIELIPETHAAIRERCSAGQTVVVATAPVFGARVAQEHLGIPSVTVQLQPAAFRSLYETPRLPMVPLPAWQPRFFKRFVYWLADRVVDRAIAEPLNAYRSQFQLPPGAASWLLVAVAAAGDRWVVWFAAPQPDWPPRSLLAGFPLYDGAGRGCDACGSRRFPAPRFPADCLHSRLRDAARRVVLSHGCRSVPVARSTWRAVDWRDREQLPASLPERVCHFDYLPLSRLLPHCAVLVHHGGIGTTAQAFACGIPQADHAHGV